jgi:hypothetical protein
MKPKGGQPPIIKQSNPNNPKPNKMENTKKQIVGWAVVYVATQKAKVFVGIKNETIAGFYSQKDAIDYCESCNMGEPLDELHIGYRVYPMNWLPKGITLK